MVAILFEEDQHSREVLRRMLNQLGYTTVFSVSNLNEANYYFQKYGNQIRLILTSAKRDIGVNQSLAQQIQQNPVLHLSPLIVLTHFRWSIQLTSFSSRISRVDSLVPKPFGLRRLARGISEANQRRAKLRSTLLYIGEEKTGTLGDVVNGYGSTFHWNRILFASSSDEVQKCIHENKHRIGGILVASDSRVDAKLLKYLKRLKRTQWGATTPLAILSHQPNQTAPFRNFADLFFEESKPVRESLSILSTASLYHWKTRILLQHCRHLVKTRAYWKARWFIRKILKTEPLRPEAHALLGFIFSQQGQTQKAIRHFEISLKLQPCAPFPYLSLAKLKKGSDRHEILNIAKSYCPHHPQIQSDLKPEGAMR